MTNGRVSPCDSDTAVSVDMINVQLWQSIYREMLKEITCDGKIKPKYKHGLLKRIWYSITIPVCGAACCTPCLVWDCFCCCTDRICCGGKSTIKYGCGMKCMVDSCTDAYQDSREQKLKTLDTHAIRNAKEAVYIVCKEYLDAFHTSLQNKNSRVANIIRAQLVDIIRTYGPYEHMMLRDDGNLEVIKTIVTVQMASK